MASRSACCRRARSSAVPRPCRSSEEVEQDLIRLGAVADGVVGQDGQRAVAGILPLRSVHGERLLA